MHHHRLLDHAQLGFLTGMTYIAFNENAATGTLPTQLGLLTNMEVPATNHADGDNNQPAFYFYEPSMSGTLPTELGQYSKLEYGFGVRIRGMTGTFPTEIGQLTSLSDFGYINIQTSVTGTIPTQLGQLTAMKSNLIPAYATQQVSG